MGDLEQHIRLGEPYPGAARLSPDEAAAAPERTPRDPTRVVLRRYAQFAIEQAIMVIVCIVLLFLILFGTAVAKRHTDDANALRVVRWALAVALIVVLTALDWWFTVWLPHRGRGATPGMRLLGLRIVTEGGETPTLRAYTIRWLLMVVDGALYGLVGAVVMAVSRRHQRVGDMVARTLVVRRDAEPDPLRADDADPGTADNSR